MRSLCFAFVLGCSFAALAQSSSNPANSSQGNSSQSPNSPPSSSSNDKAPTAHRPNLEPPHSDRVNADALPDTPGESSSKDTQIDLSPPPENDARRPGNPNSTANAATTSDTDVNEMHPWDPHKAAKDVEIGDFYFKQKNYVGAESRYREALEYKDNDAVATFRLAVCLEKMDRLEEAREAYQSYLKILPHGPQAADARKAIERLSSPTANAKAAK